jgi:hypothetical protein
MNKELEEAINKYFRLSHSRLINEQQKEYERELFIAGANWQEKKMYSEEDMKKMYDISCGKIGLGYLDDQTKNNERFNSFLNKIKK